MAATATTTATATATTSPLPTGASKREGNISDSFASLAGIKNGPLPDEFRLLKQSLVQGREQEIKASWNRLLDELRVENEIVAERGSAVIPEVRYAHLTEDLQSKRQEIRKRGAVVVRGVIPEEQARGYKFELDEYIKKNPQTKGFPEKNPQVWELYWSPAQMRARTHPNLMTMQRALMQSTWHTNSLSGSDALVSLAHPLAYADRLRMREPGDAAFALGPHQDGGSVERWMRQGYGLGGTYDAVFAGVWDSATEGYDPWDASTRVDVQLDLYNGLGACSAFRMYQGWLSLSETGPKEGSLQVGPLLKLATAYTLLRPFFKPKSQVQGLEAAAAANIGSEERRRFLDKENWVFTGGEEMTSEIQGATPGFGMEFPQWALHPHLELDRTMVHVPRVRPGDYVAWHCDTIHAVDLEHKGKGDSSVLYIPICPATETNAKYVVRMREAWRNGTPGPDFPGGKGESEHVGRPDEAHVRSVAAQDALASLGLAPLIVEESGAVSGGAKDAVRRVNKILGF
ncbi:hypothetical protein BD289DRAFT_374616 [Coniella lustricola]|uniref:DUF1479 domain protein n=1 Tax=Coniella lustricola TaxID=2025994 RepID=A0A2T2ZZF4_9PEZI|nr:hypothetical protein BD289DRAFT_374616 [Coniella lustricola]